MARRSASYTSWAPVGFGPVLLLVPDWLRMAAVMEPPFEVIAVCIFMAYKSSPIEWRPVWCGRKTVRAGMKAEKRSGRAANVRLAADIGGTFTDIAVFDD